MKMIPITQGCPAGDLDCAGWNDGYHRDENGHLVSDVTNIEGQEFSGNIANKHLYLLSKQFKINKLCYNDSTDETCKKVHNNFNAGAVTASFMVNDLILYSGYSSIGVDINGIKGPNKRGRDRFGFDITAQDDEKRYNIPQGTVVPVGSKLYADIYNQPNYYWRNNNYCTTENVNRGYYFAEYCTGRVLEEDAMNY